MKICHVINSLNRGGAESHLLDLINAQLIDGMDVHVTVIGEDSTESYSIESELVKNGINITRLNGPRMFNLFSYFSMYSQFRNEKFDVIHSHQPRSDFMVYRINKYLSIKSKWIVSVHGKYDTYLEKGSLSNNLRKYFMKRLSKHWQSASSIIAISEEVKSWIENLNHELNVAVIPYWIDIKNSETIEKKGTVTLGFLGRLNVNKGIEDLLNALNSDKLKSLDFTLMIGGSGTEEYLEKLRNMIEQDKTEKVNFLGYIKNREEFFNNIDIFVFPS
ncbi:glycosyltransferase family 4 protein, partial [Acidimicrobiaceae bacterium]|nr:glycosyltransferase family 4 protein [Acidimicrobiaceae bacterium]